VGNCPYRLGRSEREGGLLPSLLCRISDEINHHKISCFHKSFVHVKLLHEFFMEEAIVEDFARKAAILKKRFERFYSEPKKRYAGGS